MQYEISNFGRPGFHSLHNLRYWERRPYLGVGLDASSALRGASQRVGKSASQRVSQSAENSSPVLRSKTTDDLQEYLAGPRIVETAWLDSAQRHEEAWFLGLRLNAGVDAAELEGEFGIDLVGPACEVAERLVRDGLLEFDGHRARLTPRGRMLSNDVFQEFLSESASQRVGESAC